MLVAGWLIRILKLAYYLLQNPMEMDSIIPYTIQTTIFLKLLNWNAPRPLALAPLPFEKWMELVALMITETLWYTNDISKDNEEDVMYTVHRTFDKTISS